MQLSGGKLAVNMNMMDGSDSNLTSELRRMGRSRCVFMCVRLAVWEYVSIDTPGGNSPLQLPKTVMPV